MEKDQLTSLQCTKKSPVLARGYDDSNQVTRRSTFELQISTQVRGRLRIGRQFVPFGDLTTGFERLRVNGGAERACGTLGESGWWSVLVGGTGGFWVC